MVIMVKDYIGDGFSSKDGQRLFDSIKPILDSGMGVTISFKGVDAVSASFINTAFIELLKYFSFDFIKVHVGFRDTYRHINDLIKKRFHFEVSKNPPHSYHNACFIL